MKLGKDKRMMILSIGSFLFDDKINETLRQDKRHSTQKFCFGISYMELKRVRGFKSLKIQISNKTSINPAVIKHASSIEKVSKILRRQLMEDLLFKNPDQCEVCGEGNIDEKKGAFV